MKKVLIYCFALIMTGVMLVFTSGVSYYVHQCKANDSRETSLFNPHFSCCSGRTECNEEAVEQDNSLSGHLQRSPCCNTSYKLIQLAPSFIPEKISKIPVVDIPLELPVFQIFATYFNNKPFSYLHKPPNIGENGKTLCIQFSAFLL